MGPVCCQRFCHEKFVRVSLEVLKLFSRISVESNLFIFKLRVQKEMKNRKNHKSHTLQMRQVNLDVR